VAVEDLGQLAALLGRLQFARLPHPLADVTPPLVVQARLADQPDDLADDARLRTFVLRLEITLVLGHRDASWAGEAALELRGRSVLRNRLCRPARTGRHRKTHRRKRNAWPPGRYRHGRLQAVAAGAGERAV